MKNTQIRFAGVGSQGLVSASVVLAQALGIVRDYEVVQTQFYAASIQGGASCGDVIFGREKIVFPWVLNPDVLVVLSQDAVKPHAPSMRTGSRVLCDSQRTVDSIFVKAIAPVRAAEMSAIYSVNFAESLLSRNCGSGICGVMVVEASQDTCRFCGGCRVQCKQDWRRRVVILQAT